MFKIINKDTGIVLIAKTEANILLASVIKEHGEDSKEYLDISDILYGLVSSCEHIAKYSKDNFKDSKASQGEDKLHKLINFINTISTKNILSPLTLEDDEFDELGVNKRSNRILKDNNNIIDINAYNLIVKHEYSINNQEIPIRTKLIYPSIENKTVPYVYDYSGGVVTGNRFSIAYIKECIVKLHNYMPKDPILLPISVIHDKEFQYYVMDKREPSFKYLCNFFDVPIDFDNEMRSRFDIRKFIKLK